ncbi:ABC transporter permease [Streptomyces physcomitrii]|uniref:ABC transporter permease n=1 Tax=Streptomyces physcomitrii TaxID=2724184 RepID=UPI00341B9691
MSARRARTAPPETRPVSSAPPREDVPQDLPAPATWLRGPYWATARTHRTALRAVLALVLLAALLVLLGQLWLALRRDQPCSGELGLDCGGFWEQASAEQFLDRLGRLGRPALLLWPAAVAAFVAGPLTGRELEHGLHRLDWTQSVTPARWLTAKLVLAAAVAVPAAALLCGVFALAEPPGADNAGWADWTARGEFETHGAVLGAYTVLAVALGALTGLVLRRGYLALALAGGIGAALPQLAASLRWELWPVRTLTATQVDRTDIPPMMDADSVRMDWGRITATGRQVPADYCTQQTGLPGKCPPGVRITGVWAEYHPRAHFWYVQLTESLLVLALAAVLVWAAYRVLRHRTG